MFIKYSFPFDLFLKYFYKLNNKKKSYFSLCHVFSFYLFYKKFNYKITLILNKGVDTKYCKLLSIK